MDNYISLPEAARLCGKSQTWTRERARRLSSEGRAIKDQDGKWQVEREAILAIAAVEIKPKRQGASGNKSQEPQRGHSKEPSAMASDDTSRDPSQMPRDSEREATLRAYESHIATLQDDVKSLRSQVSILAEENRSLRAELKAALTEPKRGGVSRFFAEIRNAKDEISGLFKGDK